MPTVINYNRARLNNISNGIVTTITPATSPSLLLTMGIDVAASTSFLEIESVVGFGVPTAATTLVTLVVLVDGVARGQHDAFIPFPSAQTLAFHTILENLPIGHHVIQLFASANNNINIDGPVTMSGWVLA
jgi:hypothetical protein